MSVTYPKCYLIKDVKMTTDEIIDCLETTGLNQEFVCQFYEEMELFAKLILELQRTKNEII